VEHTRTLIDYNKNIKQRDRDTVFLPAFHAGKQFWIFRHKLQFGAFANGKNYLRESRGTGSDREFPERVFMTKVVKRLPQAGWNMRQKLEDSCAHGGSKQEAGKLHQAFFDNAMYIVVLIIYA